MNIGIFISVVMILIGIVILGMMVIDRVWVVVSRKVLVVVEVGVKYCCFLLIRMWVIWGLIRLMNLMILVKVMVIVVSSDVRIRICDFSWGIFIFMVVVCLFLSFNVVSCFECLIVMGIVIVRMVVMMVFEVYVVC